MKRILLLNLLSIVFVSSFAQSYNEDKTALANFLTRMYKSSPFEGVRVVDDYEQSYLLSVLSLDPSKYPDERAMNRVASVKAMSQASRFFNGSNIRSELIIRTSEKSDGSGDTEIIENIRENSVGYVKALEELTNFKGKDNRKVFIFYKKLEKEKKN
jgi:hypothetical protein